MNIKIVLVLFGIMALGIAHAQDVSNGFLALPGYDVPAIDKDAPKVHEGVRSHARHNKRSHQPKKIHRHNAVPRQLVRNVRQMETMPELRRKLSLVAQHLADAESENLLLRKQVKEERIQREQDAREQGLLNEQVARLQIDAAQMIATLKVQIRQIKVARQAREEAQKHASKMATAEWRFEADKRSLNETRAQLSQMRQTDGKLRQTLGEVTFQRNATVAALLLVIAVSGIVYLNHKDKMARCERRRHAAARRKNSQAPTRLPSRARPSVATVIVPDAQTGALNNVPRVTTNDGYVTVDLTTNVSSEWSEKLEKFARVWGRPSITFDIVGAHTVDVCGYKVPIKHLLRCLPAFTSLISSYRQPQTVFG